MQVLIFVSHFNPCDVSTTSKIASPLHPCIISNLSSSILYVCLTISVLYQVHPGHKLIVWTPSMYVLTFKVPRLTSHLHPGNISPSARCRYSCFTFTQVVSYLQPALDKCGKPACRSQVTPIQVEIWVSPPSTSNPTSTKAHQFTSKLCPGRMSPQPMSR